MPLRDFFYRESHGVRVTVRPRYVADQSVPDGSRYMFAYRVRIENVGPQPVQLLWRRWLIHDDVGEDTEVIGDGVVGEQPTLRPGGVHEYQSFCLLKSPSGYMEGHYGFVRGDGSRFDAQIPRFTLDANTAPG